MSAAFGQDVQTRSNATRMLRNDRLRHLYDKGVGTVRTTLSGAMTTRHVAATRRVKTSSDNFPEQRGGFGKEELCRQQSMKYGGMFL